MQGFSDTSIITLIEDNRAQEELVAQVCFQEMENFKMLGYDEDEFIFVPVVAKGVDVVGIDEVVYQYEFNHQYVISCTKDLQVLCESNTWKSIGKLSPEDRILSQYGSIQLTDIKNKDTDYVFEIFANQQPIVVNGLVVRSEKG